MIGLLFIVGACFLLWKTQLGVVESWYNGLTIDRMQWVALGLAVLGGFLL